MAACSSCGTENPDGSKFCNECATPLGAPARLSRRGAQGRHRAVLRPGRVHRRVGIGRPRRRRPDAHRLLRDGPRRRSKAHGGVVEKFIGDAVVGVFGVPAAHEDDPERAVRAGLRICEDAEELQALGGAPLKAPRRDQHRGGARASRDLAAVPVKGSSRETRSTPPRRIQSVAPEMGVAVGLGTYEATTVGLRLRGAGARHPQGKSEPVGSSTPRTRWPGCGTDLTRTHDTPFIGREIDLALLKGIFDKTLAATSPQLVTVVGEPGLGKSRIVAELGAYIDDEARPDHLASGYGASPTGRASRSGRSARS